ncbi:MAG: hypothetical protein JWR87_1218 [Segetibacter sp.]|jgi:hypothetical protein|nr:hypothetical protein [Segetibacter sp.]
MAIVIRDETELAGTDLLLSFILMQIEDLKWKGGEPY